MSRTIAIMICLTYLLPFARAEENSADTKSERIQLDNGVTLLLAPLPDAKVVAVESIYLVGFCDEPAGMTQAARLLEHLMCRGATKGYEPGESFAILSKLGMANAETMPTFTHYDYTAPPNGLKTILKIEGERLSSLKFTPELISNEADKCHESAQIVHQHTRSGMLKYAFMALFQFWNHGATEVRVRSGMDQLPADKLEAFYRAQYRPDQLTIVIVGHFNKEEAIALAKDHLGSIPSQKVEQKPVDWNALPPRAHITWDADVYAICLYYPPPADAAARNHLTLWGAALSQKLELGKPLCDLADMTFSSNFTWPVGELPLFAYATTKSADKIPQIEQLLRDRFLKANIEVASDLLYMRIGAHGMGIVPSWNELNSRAVQMAKETGRPEDEIMARVLGNAALQWGLREINGMAVGSNDFSEQRLKAILEKTFNPAKLRIVTLGPPPPTKEK